MQPGKKILHYHLSYKIVGYLFTVHSTLGRFRREKEYGDLLEEILRKNAIAYKRELRLPTASVVNNVSRSVIDFLIEDTIIVELKAKTMITKEDYYQVQRYLAATDKDLAIIVNFRKPSLCPKRILNIQKFNQEK